MPKGDRLYLGHMLDMAREALQMMEDIDRAAFEADTNLRLAQVHRIQIIGEAARRVSAAGRRSTPAIPWRQVTGMRHRVVHDYMTIDYDIVWDVLTRDLPPLIAALEAAILGLTKE
jgi:uncharacterized protein with HEPN domain